MIYAGLLLFFVLEYVRPGQFLPALNILKLNSIVPVTVFLASTIRGRTANGEVLRSYNSVMLAAFLGLLVLSVLTAPVTLFAFNVFMSVLGYVLVYWVLSKELDDLKRMKGVMKILIFIHIVVAILSPEMLLDPDSRTHVVASGSFLGDGNDFALSINIVIPFCLFLLFEARKLRERLLYIGALLFLVICVIATQSRGGTLALALVGVYYWMKSDKKLWTAAVAVVVVALIFVYAPPTYFDRMGTITSHEDGSAQGRIDSWKYAWSVGLSSPLLGAGAGYFPILHHQTAHSIYFLTLGELGFPGLLVLIALIVGNLVANSRAVSESRAANGDPTAVRLLACTSASMIAFATAGAFLSAIYYPHLYIVAGLLTAARRIVRSRDAEAPVGATAQGPSITYHWALARGSNQGRL